MHKSILFPGILLCGTFALSACKNSVYYEECLLTEMRESTAAGWDTSSVEYDQEGRIISISYYSIDYGDNYIKHYWEGDNHYFIRYCKNADGEIISYKYYFCCIPPGEIIYDSILFSYSGGKIISSEEFDSDNNEGPDYNHRYYYDVGSNLIVDSQFVFGSGELVCITRWDYYYDRFDNSGFNAWQKWQNKSYNYLPFQSAVLLRSITRTWFYPEYDYVRTWNFSYAFDEYEKVKMSVVTLTEEHETYTTFQGWYYTFDWMCSLY